MHTHGIDDADGQLEYMAYSFSQFRFDILRFNCRIQPNGIAVNVHFFFSIPTPYAYRTKLQLCVCVQLGMVRAQSRQRSMKEEKNTFREIMQRKAFNEIHHN